MQKETTAEKELDAEITSIPARARRTRTVAIMLTATPVIVAAILFSFSSGLAAHYERKFIAAEEELRAIKAATVTPSPAVTVPTDITPELRPLIEERERIVGEINQALNDANKLRQDIASANQLIDTHLRLARASHASIVKADDEHNNGTSEFYDRMIKYTEASRPEPNEPQPQINCYGILANMKGMFVHNEREHLQIADAGGGNVRYTPGNIISSYRKRIVTAIDDSSTQQQGIASKLTQFAEALSMIERKQRELATANEKIQAVYNSHIAR